MSGKQITLTLSQDDAMIIRDALIDASLALRTNSKDVLIAEEKFLTLPITDKRKQRYLALRDYATRLREFCQ